MAEKTVRDSAQSGENPAPLAVLIVDDEPLILWSLRQALLGRGHDVATAGSASEALALLTASPDRFHVVILDYRLPDRHDLSLAEEVRQISPNSAVLIMTAFADDDMRARARDRGVRAVVDKPFQVKAFVSLIESTVAS